MRGSLPLKVRIPGCDPVRRLSGTSDPNVHKALKRMLYALHEQGRDDLVNGIAKGTLKPLQVYNRWKFSRLEDLPHADELPTFADLWPEWVERLECSDDHRRACRGYCERIAKRLTPEATVHALPDMVRDFRVTYKDHPRAFTACKNTVARFLRDTLGKRHKLYEAVRDIPDLKYTPTRRKTPLSADRLRTLVMALDRDFPREGLGGMAWSMATTGMGWREYAGTWEREGEGLRIHGTKTGGRDRLIPYIGPITPVQNRITEQHFRRRLKAAMGVTTYDLRRTFAGLMVEAMIPRPRRKAYLGHTPDDISAIYEQQEVRDYLIRDAQRLREVLGEPTTGPQLRVMGDGPIKGLARAAST